MSIFTDDTCCNCKESLNKIKRKIKCVICNNLYHQKCTSLSIKQYNYLIKTESKTTWYCSQCLSDIFPFHAIDNQVFNELFSFDQDTSCYCSNSLSYSRIENLQCYNIMSSISNSPHLCNNDIDLQLPYETNFKYYTSHEFHASEEVANIFNNKSFSALHLNIRSLSANFDPLCNLLFDLHHSFSIIGLSETKIKYGDDPIINLDLPGYNFISQATLSNAGGVGFYVNNDIVFSKREDLSCSENEHESLWIEIQNNHQHNIICGVVYRHPTADIDATLTYLFNTIEKIHSENKYCILMGDFNINLLNFETHTDTDTFINTLGSYCFHPQILQPTRITDHSATLIDNIFFNSLEHIVISGNILCDITDHLPNFLIVNKISNLTSGNFKYYKRDYSKFNKDSFQADMSSLEWHSILERNNNINDTFEIFHSKTMKIVDKHVPLVRKTRKEIKTMSKPWITPGIRNSIKVKNRLYKKYLMTKNDYYKSKFKHYRNKLNHLQRISKRTYYENYFAKNNQNIKNIWKGIKQLITLKPRCNNIPTKIIKDNHEITNTRDICQAFNDYFSNVGKNLADTIPTTNTTPSSTMGEPVINSFFMYATTKQEIEMEISKLKSSKATGPFSIPIDLLKIARSSLSTPLQIIYNISFSTGLVPDQFKIANVIPIYKRGPETMLNNYRPISLLSVFNKILEKLVYRRLLSFIDSNKLLYNKQFGFRSKRSTVQLALSITDSIQQAIEKRWYACGIFLDFSKAFDTVNHAILLEKLYRYGIRGIPYDWFSSYLSNRRQFVSIGNIQSHESEITCGVPQGSVLGPLLFLLYINDFHNCSKAFEFNIFADDTNLFYANASLVNLESIINENLKKVIDWLAANKLSLNIDKTNFVLFHPTQRIPNYEISLLIRNNRIKHEKYIKYLGILLDSNLSWKYHISHLAKKIKRCVGIISKIRYFVGTEILQQLYYTLIYPYLTYALTVWGNTYASNLSVLTLLQKKVVRIITFSSFKSHTSPLFKHLNILKFPDLIYYQNALFMFDFHTGNLPTIFDNFFKNVAEVHNYNTRSSAKQLLYLPKVRTNYGKFNIRYRGSVIWNSIDNEIKSLKRYKFKASLKKSLLQSYL